MIRLATAADMPACAQIVNDWIDATDWMPRIHTRESVQDFYCNHVFKDRTVLVTDDGTAFMATDGTLITALYVRPEARGQGHGRALLDAGRSGPQQLWTHQANTPARGFYAHLGFEELRRTDGDNEENLPDVFLERAP